LSHLQIPKTDSRLLLKIGLNGGSLSIDPATQGECVAFVRLAIAEADRQTALDIKNVLTEVFQRGADRAAIWNEHHLNKPPTARGRLQNPQIHSQKFELLPWKHLSNSSKLICERLAPRSKPPPQKLANFCVS